MKSEIDARPALAAVRLVSVGVSFICLALGGPQLICVSCALLGRSSPAARGATIRCTRAAVAALND